MRLVAGTVLVARGIEGLLDELPFGPPLVHFARIGLGLLASAGLWTPVIGILVAILEIGLLVRRVGDPWLHVLLATLAASLSLLGPGAWSVDAHLFGRRRIDIRDCR